MQGSFLAVLLLCAKDERGKPPSPLNGPCHHSHHSPLPAAHTLSSRQDRSCYQGVPFALSHFKHIPCPHQDTAYFTLGLPSHLPLGPALWGLAGPRHHQVGSSARDCLVGDHSQVPCPPATLGESWQHTEQGTTCACASLLIAQEQ